MIIEYTKSEHVSALCLLVLISFVKPGADPGGRAIGAINPPKT